jgi:hypothetical protein
MSSYEYRLVAGGWFILIVVLTIFWYAMLRRLAVILKERLASTGSHRSIDGMGGMFLFIFRGEFKSTGDERLVTFCRKLRSLLYGYLGGVGAFIVFVIVFRPRF